MSNLPGAGALSAATTQGIFKGLLEDQRNSIAELLGGAPESELTIAIGGIAPTGGQHRVDTENNAEADDLENIAITNHPAGRILILRLQDATRVVTVKHQAGGIGQILLLGQTDITLDNVDRVVCLRREDNGWRELFRTESSVGKQTINLPAGSWRPTSTNGCDGPVQVENTAQRPEMLVLDFDQTSQEHAQQSVTLPKSWNGGTITYKVQWYGNASTDGVTWGMRAVGVSDGESIDRDYGRLSLIQDNSQGAPTKLLITEESPPLSIANAPVAGDDIYLDIFRRVLHAGDNMAADARLSKVVLFFTTNKGEDS